MANHFYFLLSEPIRTQVRVIVNWKCRVKCSFFLCQLVYPGADCGSEGRGPMGRAAGWFSTRNNDSRLVGEQSLWALTMEQRVIWSMIICLISSVARPMQLTACHKSLSKSRLYMHLTFKFVIMNDEKEEYYFLRKWCLEVSVSFVPWPHLYLKSSFPIEMKGNTINLYQPR